MNEKWFSLEINQIENILKTNAACGITRKAARSRLRKAGRNDFFYLKTGGVRECFLTVFRNPMLLLIIAMTVIAALFGEIATAVTCGIMIVIYAVLSLLSYMKAQQIIESTAEYSQPKVRVIRDGRLLLTDARGIVRGDVVPVSAGDVVPCDMRLVSSDGLSVLVYGGKKTAAVRQEKDAAADCTAENVGNPLSCPNMLHAGSVVLTGSGRAIVAETGKYTYIGALEGGVPISDNPRSLQAFVSLKRFEKTYSFVVLLTILPLMAIGIFTCGTNMIMNTFMTVLALAVSSLGELIGVIGSIIIANGIFDAATGNAENNGAIIKSPSKLGDIACADYVFMLGDAALTDGKLRIVAAVFGGTVYDGGQLFEKSLYPAAEALLITENAAAAYPVHGESAARRFAEGVRYYSERVGVDERAFDIRMKINSFRISEKTEVVSVTDAGVPKTVICSSDISLVSGCELVRTPSGTVKADGEIKKQIADSLARMIENGCEVRQAFSVTGSFGMIFEGAFGFKKNPFTAASAKSLRKMGVTPLFFSENETPAESVLVKEAEIAKNDTEIARYSEFVSAGADIMNGVGRYTAYLGFPKKQISMLLSQLQNEGKTVICTAISHRHLSLAEKADVSVTFDRTSYKTGHLDIERLEKSRDSGKDESVDASPCLRCSSDVLVKRAGMRGGGLAGIVNAVKTARSIHLNLAAVVRYLLSAELVRLAVTVPALICGITLLTPSQLLYSGLVLDFAAALVFATGKNAETTIGRHKYKTEGFRKPIAFYGRELTVVGISGFAVAVAAIIISFTTKRSVGGSVFISLVLTQLAMLLLKRDNIRPNPACLAVMAAGAVGSVILMLAAGPLPSALSLLLIPLSPAVFIASELLTRKTQKKGKL